MIKVGIIGMGTISRHYLRGIKESKELNLVAVCDKNENYATKELYGEYKYYAEYLSMIKGESLDCVIISTPPATHYQIAKECLTAGVNVIIEKPVVLEMNLLKDLYSLADKSGLEFKVMYHWQNGQEVEELLKRYDKNQIKSIKVCVLDPYCNNGQTINDDRVILEGAWIDSGVNALSYAKCFLDFNQYEIKCIEVKKCAKTGLPIYAHAKLKIDGVEVEILVDWTTGKELKQSEIVFGDNTINISHSLQTIYDKETKIECNDMVRLTRHYYNFFTKNINESSNQDATVKIHDILFNVRSKYEEFVG